MFFTFTDRRRGRESRKLRAVLRKRHRADNDKRVLISYAPDSTQASAIKHIDNSFLQIRFSRSESFVDSGQTGATAKLMARVKGSASAERRQVLHREGQTVSCKTSLIVS